MTEDEIHKIAAIESSHWWYVGMREICFSLLAPYLAGRSPLRILDVGCGTGGNLAELARFGDARGVDLSPLCVDYCRQRQLACQVGSMSALDLPPASLDLVTMFDVLTQAERSEMPGILRDIAAGLAPGGLLAFREPAMAAAAGAHDRAVNIRHRFSVPEVRAMLDEAGLEPLRATYLNTLLFLPIVATRRLKEASSPGAVVSDVRPTPEPLNTLLLSALRAEAGLLRLTDFPFGVSLFAVGRKRPAA